VEALFPLLLWVSQLLLGVQCSAPTEGVVETTPEGTSVGAISADETCGYVGFFFERDGTITFENHTD
jgi:hypothetical protein